MRGIPTFPHINNPSQFKLAAHAITPWLDQVERQSDANELQPLFVALLRNICEGIPRIEATTRAVTWTTIKILPRATSQESQELFRECFVALQTSAAEPVSRKYLESIRPIGDQHFLLWASASMYCIEEIEDEESYAQAIDWLKGIVINEIGETSYIIWVSEQREPSIDEPHEAWADETFKRIIKIKDLDTRSQCLTWLEGKIATFVGENAASAWITLQTALQAPKRLSNQPPKQTMRPPARTIQPAAPKTPITDTEINRLASELMQQAPNTDRLDAINCVRRANDLPVLDS